MQQVQNTQNAQNNAFNAATSPPLTHYLAAVRLGKEEIKEIHITGIPPSMKKKRKGHRKELLREKHNFQRTNITSSSNKMLTKLTWIPLKFYIQRQILQIPQIIRKLTGIFLFRRRRRARQTHPFRGLIHLIDSNPKQLHSSNRSRSRPPKIKKKQLKTIFK